MRYIAPERHAIGPSVFNLPLFDFLSPAQRAMCVAMDWPDVAALNALWQAPMNRYGQPYRFFAQAELPDDLHYECRIEQHGVIATRADNWHDLFNAFIWHNFPHIKQALNAAQVADIEVVGSKLRTPRQSAMTHFDEAGAIVRLNDAAMQAAWDEHDWPAFFACWPDAHARGALQLWPFGHSLFEHALNPDIALVAKAVVFHSTDHYTREAVDVMIAQAIRQNGCIDNPQALRPIPLSGIEGWQTHAMHADYASPLGCFRPKRAGKIYPPPITP